MVSATPIKSSSRSTTSSPKKSYSARKIQNFQGRDSVVMIDVKTQSRSYIFFLDDNTNTEIIVKDYLDNNKYSVGWECGYRNFKKDAPFYFCEKDISGREKPNSRVYVHVLVAKLNGKVANLNKNSEALWFKDDNRNFCFNDNIDLSSETTCSRKRKSRSIPKGLSKKAKKERREVGKTFDTIMSTVEEQKKIAVSAIK